MTVAQEPATPNAVAAAVQWIGATLSGSVATAIAVIAIASIGLLMLSGRVDVRRAAQVLLGCFIVFGASSIASGIIRSLHRSGNAEQLASPATPPLTYPPAVAQAPAADTYAGAAVPPRR